jgi:hypothetical protein
VVTGAGSVTVTGSGSAASPYVVSGGGSLTVTDTSTVDLTLTGNGSTATPYALSATATLNLDALTDVQTAAATTGQVLAKQASGQWIGVAPTTAPTGAINVSGGVEGDGSAGNPLSVKLPASSGLIEDSTGLRVEGAGVWTAYTPVLTTAGAGADPTIGNGTLTGRYTRIGNLVFFAINFTAGTTTKRGSGYLEVTLPVTMLVTPMTQQPSCHFHGAFIGIGDFRGGANLDATKVIRTWTNTLTNGRGGAINHSNPATFTAGSQMMWAGNYEAA